MSDPSHELLARYRSDLIGKVTLVQEGAITAAPAPGLSFVDRADGFILGLLNWKRGDVILDSATRWAHWKPRS